MTKELILIAGRGAFPIELATSARAQGVERLVALAFKGETRKTIAEVCDEVAWVNVGHLDAFRTAIRGFGMEAAVMAGQITPSNLFHARLDKPMRELLGRLDKRNADTIFGAVADELRDLGTTLLPARRFMASCRVAAGVLTRSGPSESQSRDIAQGMELACTCARLQAGQSVALKEGTVIAVEGFEGTDEMILRAGKLAGAGCVIVKAAQPDHDHRWDTPVVGMTTLKSLKKARCACLAVEAGQVMLLEKEKLVEEAAAAGVVLVAVEGEG